MNKIWLTVVLVVVVVGTWWVYSNKTNLSDYVYMNQNQTNYSPSPVAGTATKPVGKKSTVPAFVPASTKSYSEFVKEYEGRRIQFDERCQVIPQNPTYKNGTSILLDNRSASVRTVMVGGMKYDLVAYGYRVVTLSSPSLPKELSLSCGSAGNVGVILLQAQILQ